MKKKPLTTYPSIPAPKVDQFTLPELINELFRNKQFTSGIQNLLSNCIVTKSIPQQKQKVLSKSNNISKIPFNSPTSSSKEINQRQVFLSSTKQETLSSIIPPNSDDECEFIFQKQVKNRMMYPWHLDDNGKQEIVECNLITDEITEFIQDTIECSLHKILNKEFINVTNQILAMREEINVFTKNQLQRTQTIKNQVNRQLQKMQKKLQQQQHISTSLLTQPLEKFTRSKGMLNGSSYKTPNKQPSKFDEIEEQKGSSIHHDVFTLKKQVQNLKKSSSLNPQSQKSVNNQAIKQIQQRLITNQEKINDLTLSVKLSLEEYKQNWRKSHQKLSSQLATSTSKQYLSKQVKKTVQSNLKIYLDEIMKCKKEIQNLYDRLQKNDKGLQQYIGNQLKNVWTLISGIKTRIQNIQEQFNVGMDMSFVL